MITITATKRVMSGITSVSSNVSASAVGIGSDSANIRSY